MDPITLLSAFIPVISDGARGLINKFTGGAGAKPANVEEAIKMVDADIRRLEALSKLDAVGSTSVWVNNIRALQRPTIGLMIISAWAVGGYLGIPEDQYTVVSNLAASVVFYLFGDRTYMHFKRKE